MGKISKYYEISKPGIVVVNVFTAYGGIILASAGDFELMKSLFILLGTILVVASGCALNNVLDIEIDRKMERTRNRVMVQRGLSIREAVTYSLILLFLSLCVLYIGANALTAGLSLFGWLVYIFPYTIGLKRRNSWGIVVGGISGAIPPLIGYCGIQNKIDLAAIILFCILFVWQLPHSWAIVIRRLEDYKHAGIMALPDMKVLTMTKALMLSFGFLLLFVTYSLTYFKFTGIIYGTVAIVTGVFYFLLCLSGLWRKDDRSWAKNVFIYSVLHITVLIVFLTMDLKYNIQGVTMP